MLLASILGAMLAPQHLIFAVWAFWKPRNISTLLWTALAVAIIFTTLNETAKIIYTGITLSGPIAPFVWSGLAVFWHRRKSNAPKEPANWAQTLPEQGDAASSKLRQRLEKYSDVGLWKKFAFFWTTNARLLAMGISANWLPLEARVELKEQLRKSGLSPIEAAVVMASRLPVSSQPYDKIVRRVQEWSNQMDDTHPLVHQALIELGFHMSDESYFNASKRAGQDSEQPSDGEYEEGFYSLLAKKEGSDASNPDLDPKIEKDETGKYRVGDKSFPTLYSAQAFLQRKS